MGALLAGGLPGLLNQSSAQVIDGSLKFDNGSSNYLSRTPSAAGNKKTWTWSGWIKRDIISAYQHPLIGGSNGTGHGVIVRFSPAAAGTDTLQIGEYVSGWNWQLITSGVFRDTGWYHIVIAVDTTQTSSSDRVKLYINGTLETSFGTSSYPSLNYDTLFNTNTLQVLGGQTWNGSINAYYGGRLSNVYLIDGLALGPGYFGFTDPLTNTWRPKKFRAGGTTVNDGTVWSSGTVTGTAANASGSGGWTQAFDGNTANLVYPTDSNGSTKIVLPKPIRFFSNVRLYAGQKWQSVDREYDVSFPHHKSHAAAGYYTAPFDDCNVLVIDSIGEWDTVSIWEGKDNKLKKIKSWKYPYSLGLLYSAITKRIGLKPNEDEYITMGMAAYGVPKYTKEVKELLNKDYLTNRFKSFDYSQSKSSKEISPGKLITESKETTHYSIVDKFGNAVSVTTTLNGNYGSKLIPGNLGFFLKIRKGRDGHSA